MTLNAGMLEQVTGKLSQINK